MQRFLRALTTAGCAVVPRPLGFDSEGREIVEFINGDVPGPSVPPGVVTAETLFAIGELIGQFRDAAETYRPHPDDRWFSNPPIPKPFSGPVIGHNDIDLGNIVFRHGTPYALIDFDFAAPSDIVWEVAVAAFYLVPLRETAEYSTGVITAGLSALLEGCRLPSSARRRLPEAVIAFHDHRRARTSAAGRMTPAWEERHRRDSAWLRQWVSNTPRPA